ncbi:enhancer of mRNA-decapping protein 3 [Neodiprion pinetum]|uniref:Enhancer of mRNA-decapping protein 3 n=1 Tax=Neodiprion lecontei TaxID=441921 RepID=A0A6J0C2H6_NEOLC|nr:enhancer of mRNA-decapping protein 3 [Neodiprion lecontei]XP_046434496.1 enhancer of mRNA-decapping protein 3 [Neodiprion fabricii]XP_046434497.1 enhancer of mRNA-decapping protein 3 [Neodiprion fabricii]XP_046434498.1 enhancer of mRNA-decapping protein 3 [Neodiprion fabricii]XP_046434500.1 enhancer of mRNA-decapping protein 3 [Neodiprion fabricii]XP_046490401.1 enhancer of mRNA-decapping protein 3 [Neodiprion pinetum]XP_046490402.1 enhancer of mRNA-decapping protein 3 [Neodiprion pinetum]
MSTQFLGCTVSVKCDESLGTYQGQIVDLNGQTVTLTKAFRNGVPYPSPQVVLSAKDILHIEIISTEEAEDCRDEVQTSSKVTVRRPIAKRAGRSVSECIPPLVLPNSDIQQQSNARKPLDSMQSHPEPAANGKIYLGEISTKNQKRSSQRQRWQEKDEQAFGTPIDQSMEQDFDFEKNLALFNKEAVWQEINSLKPDIVRQSENTRGSVPKYRHDENVIESEPTAFRQIAVPSAGIREYVTDDGLVIPSITVDLHRQLIGAADRLGISWDRRVELLGRAGAEIILQLLGGGHRLNPNNAHQWPTVVALCGPHRSGAAGVNCARQLSSHGVKTVVYVENSEDVFLLQELSLYKLSGNRVETRYKNLPAVADLILLALGEEGSPRTVAPVATWANSNRAPVLAIEPPSAGTPGIMTKFSLLGGLPLSHSADNGRLYLCNLALPAKVFSDVGITYRSPFGPKFVIPLHSNSS